MNRRDFFKSLLAVGTIAVLAPARFCTACVEKVRVWKKSIWWTLPKGAKKVTVTLVGGGGGGGSSGGEARVSSGPNGHVEIESTLVDGSKVTQTLTLKEDPLWDKS